MIQRDLTGGDREIAALDASVRGGRIETQWEYKCPEDPEDGKGPPAGYSRPEYFFRVAIDGVEACSGLLFFRDWIEVRLEDARKRPLAGEEYRATLPSGETRTGKLDRDGHARLEGIPPGKVRVEIPRFPQAELAEG